MFYVEGEISQIAGPHFRQQSSTNICCDDEDDDDDDNDNAGQLKCVLINIHKRFFQLHKR